MTKTPIKRTTSSILLGSTAVVTIAIAVAVTLIPGDGVRPIITAAQAQGVSINVQFRQRARAARPLGRSPALAGSGFRQGAIATGGPTPKAAGSTPTSGAGSGLRQGVRLGCLSLRPLGLDPQLGWLWIPGDVWGPAWVQWRRGDRHAGWAPLPPQQVIYDYDDNPDYWVFVSFNNFGARNIRRVVVPQQERVLYIRQTVVVNRTIIVDRGPRIAINAGIEPRIVAARMGRPIQVVNVKPPWLSARWRANAVEIRGDQKKTERVRVEVTEKKETIAPAKDVPPPQALKKGEEGKLGDRPPTAAKETAQQPGRHEGSGHDERSGHDEGSGRREGCSQDQG